MTKISSAYKLTLCSMSVTQIPLILLLFLIFIASGSMKEQIDGGESL